MGIVTIYESYKKHIGKKRYEGCAHQKAHFFTLKSKLLMFGHTWMFPKIVVLQNGWFIMVPNPIKMG